MPQGIRWLRQWIEYLFFVELKNAQQYTARHEWRIHMLLKRYQLLGYQVKHTN